MARASPSSPQKKEPSNLLLIVLALLVFLLVYLVFRDDRPRTLQPRESVSSTQSAKPNPYVTRSGLMKPRIDPDPVESRLIDIMDPARFAIMEIRPDINVIFDQDVDVVVALRTNVQGRSRWRIAHVRGPTAVNSGSSTHIIYWAFPEMRGRDLDMKMASAEDFLKQSGMSE